jgi:heptosyltransferase-3
MKNTMKKTLIIQLARLGDVLQTYPTINAIQREGSSAVHLLTRSRFSVAVPDVIRTWQLDSRSILTPLIDEIPKIEMSLEAIDQLLTDLRAENFDEIINLSFSPLSSFITKALEAPQTSIRGYSRHEDGFLSIKDDASAYFYAQVGVGLPNRVHVTDLFAHVAGVHLHDSDWSIKSTVMSESLTSKLKGFERPILFHVGASQLGKTLDISKWMQIIKHVAVNMKAPIVLIGSKEEAAWSVNAIPSNMPNVLNMVGETSFAELVSLIAHSRLVVGADSAPMHIAALTNSPAFCVSLPQVSFWETGPKSAGSRIMRIDAPEKTTAEEISIEIEAALVNGQAHFPIISVVSPTALYEERVASPQGFEWELLKALYMGEAFPTPPHETFVESLRRLSEVNQLAIEQIGNLKKKSDNKTAASILDRADEIMNQIARMVPEAGVIVRWFNVEKTRIGPQNFATLISETAALHDKLAAILGLYLPQAQGENENEKSEISGMLEEKI